MTQMTCSCQTESKQKKINILENLKDTDDVKKNSYKNTFTKTMRRR